MNNKLHELINDIFYDEYFIYRDSVIDYFIIKSDEENKGVISHKEVLKYAIYLLNKKIVDDDIEPYNFDMDKLKLNKIENKDLFNDEYSRLFLKPPFGKPFIRDCSKKYNDEGFPIEKREYTIEDFNYLNNLLFPKGKENLEIYEGSTNWSDYFDAGNEWWGSRCVSIYDISCDRYVVILVSVSD